MKKNGKREGLRAKLNRTNAPKKEIETTEDDIEMKWRRKTGLAGARVVRAEATMRRIVLSSGDIQYDFYDFHD